MRVARRGTALVLSIASLFVFGRGCSSERTVSLLPITGAVDGGPTDGALPDAAEPGLRPLGWDGLDALRKSAFCLTWSAVPDPEPSVLLLLVDISGSMNRPLDPYAIPTITKWQVTRPALQSAVDLLPASAGLGVLFYPNMPTGDSTVPRDPSSCVNIQSLIPISRLGSEGSEQRTLIQTALMSTEPSPDFGTPTHDAYNFAVAQLERTVVPRDQRYVLLITDGQPTFLENCVGSGRITEPVDETPIINAIAQAHAQGIGTFVIGAPGSEVTAPLESDARPWLSRAAEAGGTAREGCQHDGPSNYCHFDMVEEPEFGMGLRSALTQIVGAILPCNYLVPVPPAGKVIDQDKVNVVLIPPGGEPLLATRSRQADCAEGWRFSADGRQVELCGTTCSAVQEDPRTQVELFFGCTAAEIVH